MADSNHLTQLRKFFGCTLAELSAFWKSLTDAEKSYYIEAIGKWDGHSEFIS